MYHPLGPEVDLSTTTEEEETTEEKATTGKFLAMPCFVSIFDLQFTIHYYRYYLQCVYLFYIQKSQPQRQRL